MNYDGVLARFGELGIKSAPVRRQMLNRLRQNGLDMLLRQNVEGDVKIVGSRLWFVGPDVDALLRLATRIFGVVSASKAILCESNIAAMSEVAVQFARDKKEWSSFAIRAKREGEHKFSSMDVGREVGSAVYLDNEKSGGTPKVDLENPELEIHVDVRSNGAYLFTEITAGPGGLPAGAQGHVACILDRPDAVIAAWLMMRRGCKITLVHADETQVEPMLQTLIAWGGPESSRALTTSDLIAGAWSEVRVDSVVTAETMGDEISQRPETPVLRPLFGLAEEEVARLREIITRGASQ